ncbi:Uncharacterised protein [uncultured archaeon]|nr:Uncharacterised protein [uncultured archaeon]
MVLLSFSLETKRGPAYKLIQDGTKAQTCRLPRDSRPKGLQDAQLYWKSRIPLSQKPIHQIADGLIDKIDYDTKYGSFMNDNKFAYLDGFIDAEELRFWFNQTHECSEATVFDVIHWALYHPLYRCPICDYTSAVTNIHRQCQRAMYPTGEEVAYYTTADTKIIQTQLLKIGNESKSRTLIKKYKNFMPAMMWGGTVFSNDLVERRSIPEWAIKSLEKVFGIDVQLIQKSPGYINAHLRNNILGGNNDVRS